MRFVTLLLTWLLVVSCQGRPESGPEGPPTAEGPSKLEERSREAPPTAASDPSREPVEGPSKLEERSRANVPPKDKRPAPYLRTPTLPISPNTKPVKIQLTRGGSLILPKGTREIKIEDGGDDKPTVRHYYLNHPMGRGLTVTEYPLKGRPCEALVAAREAAFEAGYAKKDDKALRERRRFHKGARCKLAQAACYYSDTSRRSLKEIERGSRFHREAAYLLCRDDVAIAVAWKIPDGAEVDTEVIDALTRIAGSLSVR